MKTGQTVDLQELQQIFSVYIYVSAKYAWVMFVHQKVNTHILVYIVCTHIHTSTDASIEAGDSLIEEIQDSRFIWFSLYQLSQKSSYLCKYVHPLDENSLYQLDTY